ncbi:Dihydrofolate reductase [Pseudoxanthomonas sp. GM95]|uniref:dihydrofolate reductase family protein n=1 Tax=Pseudoxanthomonas sp. GM95 TaxID=1881043 RepID=UPI0008B3D526|nr:dihydrofolate reductase family protein [Pseudoxanthomonas sp. GM95]SEM12030.1 Dihydrofolate reductase [Pseudoxanthomonas sp. GM95]
MRELKLAMSMTLDGFVSGPNGEIQWVFNGDHAAIEWKVQALWDASLHIMGSRTFGNMAGFWPTSTLVFAPVMNQIPKAVFSQQDPAIFKALGMQAIDAANASGGALQEGAGSWAEAYVAGGDLIDEVKRLKAQDGKPIIAHGGAQFARSLIAANLVDEYILGVYPIVLGQGQPIFADLPAPRPLTLVSTQVFPSGFQAQVFRPA